MKYKVSRNLPVAKFFYKGHHTHAVRRTVLVIESDRNYICGYELREGNEVRKLSKAPIKSYSRDKIARGRNLRAENPIRREKTEKSTLVRVNLIDITEKGI